MIYAMFAMILLTFAVAFYMLKLRIQAVKTGQIKLSYFRLNAGSDSPDTLTQASRNYSNLFEMPVFFYIAGTLAVALHLENAIMILLGWIFVASRLTHSWIHLTSNNVIHRMKAFMVGNFCVLVIWIILVWRYAMNTI